MRDILKNLIFSLIFLVMSSCGFSSKNTASDSDNLPLDHNTVGDLTIDNAGIVPIIGINQATTTSIYIHNHGDEAILNVSFNSLSVSKNIFKRFLNFVTGNPISYGIKVDPISATTCSIIPAHGSCALKFTTPSFATNGNQGSSVISAKYLVNGKYRVFNQIINYQQVELKDWINITSGVNLNSYGYDNSYGTIYLYSGNQTNKVQALELNRPAFTISNNNITGAELAPLQVQALEISAPANISSSMRTLLSVSTNGVGLTSTASITALPSNSGGILVSGILPNYDLNGQSSISGNYYTITNVGNEVVTLGDITTNNPAIEGVLGSNSCQPEIQLTVGAACNFYFNITPGTESDRISGNSLITVNYSSASVSSSSLVNVVNWINSQKSGLVSIIFNSPVTFIQNDGVYGLNESFNVTITNIGGANLRNIVVGARGVTGRLSVNSLSSCGSTLNVGSSCTINVKVSDQFVENSKQILISFAATSGLGSLSYTRSAIVTYNVITNKPLFVLQPVPLTYQIFGNAKESQTGSIIVSNNGATSTSTGRIDGSKFTQFDSFFNVDLGTGKCRLNQTLAVGESCVVTIQLKPKNESFAVGESGVAVYTLNTTGLNLGESGVTRTNIPFRVLPNNQGFKVISVVLSGSDSGDGTSTNSFKLGGEKIAPKVVITYQNESTNKLRVMGVYESGTSGIFWYRESFTQVDVNPGESFTVTYTNILGSVQANYLSNSSISPSENIMLPTLYFQDFTLAESNPTPFRQTVAYNGGAYVYVDGILGTLTNTVVVNNPGLTTESYTLSSQFGLNGRGYAGAITLNTFADISGNTRLSNTNNCTASESIGVGTVFCTLNAANLIGNAVYAVNNSYILDSNTVFNTYYNRSGYNLNTNGQAVVVNLTENTVTLPQLKWQQTMNTGITSNQKVLKLVVDSNNKKYILVTESGGSYDGKLALLTESNGVVIPLVRGIASSNYATMSVNPINMKPYIAYVDATNNMGYIVSYSIESNVIQTESSTITDNITLANKTPTIVNYVFNGYYLIDVLFITSTKGLLVYENVNLSTWYISLFNNSYQYQSAYLIWNSLNSMINIAINTESSISVGYPNSGSFNNVGNQIITTNPSANSMSISIPSNGDLFLAYDDVAYANKLRLSYYPGISYPTGGNWTTVTLSDGAAGSINSLAESSNQPFIVYTDAGNLKVVRYLSSPFKVTKFQKFGLIDMVGFSNMLLENKVIDIGFDKLTNYPLIVYVDPQDSIVKLATLPLNAGS
jgi:hypothetical protein